MPKTSVLLTINGNEAKMGYQSDALNILSRIELPVC
jgi:hypothetical protein